MWMEAGRQRQKQGENKAMPERFAPSGPEALLEALRARERFAPAEILATALAGLRPPWSVYRHHQLSAFEAGRDGGYGGLYIVLHPGKGIALVDLELAAPFSALLRLRRLLQATQFEPFLRDQPPIVALALNRGDLRNLERRLADALACAGACHIAEADWTGTAISAIASVDFGLTQVKGGAPLALPHLGPSPSAFPPLPALAMAAGQVGQALMRVAEMRDRASTALALPLISELGARTGRALVICSRLPPLARHSLARLCITPESQRRYAAAILVQATTRALVPAGTGLRKLWAARGDAQITIAQAWESASSGFCRMRTESRDALRLAAAGLRLGAQQAYALAARHALLATAAVRASLDSVRGTIGAGALAPSRLAVALPLRISQALPRLPAARRIEGRGRQFALGIGGAALCAIAAGFLVAAHGPLTPREAPPARAQEEMTASAAKPPQAAPAQSSLAQNQPGDAVVISPNHAPPRAILAQQAAGAAERVAPAEPAKLAAPAAIEASSKARNDAAARTSPATLSAPLLEPAAIPEPEFEAPAPKPPAAAAIASASPALQAKPLAITPKSAIQSAIIATPLPWQPSRLPYGPRPRTEWVATEPTRAISARERWYSPYDGPEYDYANRQSQ
jgi:hypothetical protein